MPPTLPADKWTGRESNPRTTASFAAATTTARLLCRALSYPAQKESGTRGRTSISTFRAWRPAGWTIPERFALRPPSLFAKVDAVAVAVGSSYGTFAVRERCCSSHSPDLRPWITELRRPTWGAFGARRSCGLVKFAGKSRGLFGSVFSCASGAEEPFSLRRGLEVGCRISSWASPFSKSNVS